MNTELICPKCGQTLYRSSGNGCSISANEETGLKVMMKMLRCKNCGCHPIEKKEEKNNESF